jgi:hypothetical protein
MKNNRIIPPIFDVPPDRGNRGYEPDRQTHLDRIIEYVHKPLSEVGFGCTATQGEAEVRQKKNLIAQPEATNSENRLTEEGIGNEQKIFWKENITKYLYAQIYLIEDLTHIKTNARYSIPKDIRLSCSTKEKLAQAMSEYFKKKKLYLFLFTKSKGVEYYNNFYLLKYADIPAEHYKITYKKKKNIWNRLFILDKHLGYVTPISKLEESLKSILKINT